MGYTYDELIGMGATSSDDSDFSQIQQPIGQPKRKYTYDELIKAGAQPTEQPLFTSKEPQKSKYFEDQPS